jgi:hypothetical protein
MKNSRKNRKAPIKDAINMIMVIGSFLVEKRAMAFGQGSVLRTGL